MPELHETPDCGEALQHEVRDVSVKTVVWFGVGLFVLVAGVLIGVILVFNYFSTHQTLGPPPSPLADTRQLPPAPRLQIVPAKDIEQLRQSEDDMLKNYGWVDESAGVLRIPIARAIDIVAQKGLPSRPPPGFPAPAADGRSGSMGDALDARSGRAGDALDARSGRAAQVAPPETARPDRDQIEKQRGAAAPRPEKSALKTHGKNLK